MNEKKIRRAKFMFLREKPFWSGILGVPVVVLPPPYEVEGEEIQAACTDGEQIYVNGKYLNEATPQELMIDFAHEYLHILLHHLGNSRMQIAQNEFQWQIANMAADYAVNSIIKEEFNRLNLGMLYDSRFDGMTFEQIYKELLKEMQGISLSEEESKRLESHKTWKHKKAETMNQILKQSLLRAYLQGTLPKGLHQEVEDMLYPPFPISEIISSFVLEQSYSQPDFKRINKRRYPPVLMPPIRYRSKLHIGVAIDTSGSIDKELLSEFKAGMKFLFSYFRGELEILLLQCDARLYEKRIIHEPEELDSIKWQGGGGTDFRPVFNEMEHHPELRGLIYITDTFGTPPNKSPDIPVVWLVPERYRNSHRKLPFGRMIFYEGGKGRSA
ncbi:MAG: hypothetical protein QIT36_gp042 [Methanophagales virus GBV301]|uniref:Metallopeptidase n=1 Tax=Methanophagales virus GBV301 TaxID=2999280 RepID=A0A9E8VAP7_9CAUD|nr:MAG: hypothetical protein QIT36_gp042 [Methanophagales virus GBV301]WAE39466.1 MAG: hypothetical protein LDLAKGPJ_00042 [Methanophagales virus GBV301]